MTHFYSRVKRQNFNLLFQQVNKLMLQLLQQCCSAPAVCQLSLLAKSLCVYIFSALYSSTAVKERIMMMMMMGGGGGGGGLGGSAYPFTASQWQELELQALVFKYMVSGIPVPSDLILCIRRSLFMDPHHLPFLQNSPPAIGWGGYQMGDVRKAVDPEPGRCRRTDGKKWRCSKEAYPDSKYCERHMHRGKSRSRKPVELSLATSQSFPLPPLSLSTPQTQHFLLPCSSSSSSSSRPHPALGYENSTNYCFEPVPRTTLDSCSYRNVFGFKENVNEYPFLSEGCRIGGDIPLENYGNPPYKVCVSDQKKQDKHYHLLLGADLKTERGTKLETEAENESARQFHCFLDEKPPKIETCWMGVNVDLKTQLSISIPMANHDIPVTPSQCYNDG